MNAPARIDVRKAQGARDLERARALFLEGRRWMDAKVPAGALTEGIQELPGPYAPPRGCILLADVNGRLAGCVALRPLGSGICEMEQLWVRGPFRGIGVGRRLVEAIVSEARERGYAGMRLQATVRMEAALHLCTALGFREVEQPGRDPDPGVRRLEHWL